MAERRATIRYPQEGRKYPLRVCDLVFTENGVLIEIKRSKECFLIPLEFVSNRIEHLIEEVKLEKEYD